MCFTFATVCLIITLLGIYAAISQDTERRQKEVAIRKNQWSVIEKHIVPVHEVLPWVATDRDIVCFPSYVDDHG